MKKILICLSAILCLVTRADAFAAENDRAAQPATKGYELYSWQVADGTWRYSLLPGTNRMKSNDEVTVAAVVISDAGALKRWLAELATNEQVFWHRPDAVKFSLPDPRVVEELKTYCRVLQIDLQVMP
jgi:hypothetical protein